MITEGPVSQSVPSESSVNFTCSATGYPEAIFTWYHGNTVLDAAYVTTIITVPAQYGSLLEQMSTLIIDDLTLSKKGTYTCNVNNGVGTDDASATLNVEGWCYIIFDIRILGFKDLVRFYHIPLAK